MKAIPHKHSVGGRATPCTPAVPKQTTKKNILAAAANALDETPSIVVVIEGGNVQEILGLNKAGQKIHTYVIDHDVKEKLTALKDGEEAHIREEPIVVALKNCFAQKLVRAYHKAQKRGL